MRIRKDAEGKSVAVETSVVRFERTDGDKRVTVDLIGAVHVGELEYYESLNEQMAKYEALLYELVAPEGTVIPKGGRRPGEGPALNPVAAMQQGMQAMLELEFQLEHIDYTRPNFVHADMTPEEFGESMRNNGESVSGYVLRALGQSMAMQSGGRSDPTTSLLVGLFSPGSRKYRLRRTMAQQMKQMEAGMVIFQGDDGSTMVDHRNAKCMEVMQREIKNGKTNLGIFYGAAHLADMERRLIEDFGFSRGGQHWLTAWKLTDE